jgi:UDP-4-amino-4,6-dideoxy-N-acetyl-beta-L-altrosamine N-acetyltransferase
MKVVSFEKVKFQDIELIRNWRNSKEVSQYMYTDGEISKEDQVNWYTKITNSNNSKYWIIKYDNIKIGLVNITNIDFSEGSCNWAFYIGETEYRESGAAVQTEFNIIEKAFVELNLNAINCEVISTNIHVLNLHRRFGFKIISNKQSYIIRNGFSVEIVKLVLYKNDWELIRSKIKKIIFNNILN